MIRWSSSPPSYRSCSVSTLHTRRRTTSGTVSGDPRREARAHRGRTGGRDGHRRVSRVRRGDGRGRRTMDAAVVREDIDERRGVLDGVPVHAIDAFLVVAGFGGGGTGRSSTARACGRRIHTLERRRATTTFSNGRTRVSLTAFTTGGDGAYGSVLTIIDHTGFSRSRTVVSPPSDVRVSHSHESWQPHKVFILTPLTHGCNPYPNATGVEYPRPSPAVSR